MKKKLVASLAAAMVLGLAGTSFAAANPFSDVPAKDWSYDAVHQLAQAGIVSGYVEGKMISRYEMALIVANAMSKGDKADADQKVIIDKLAAEFETELKELNVLVTGSDRKLDQFTMNGQVRVRFDKGRTNGPTVDQANIGAYTPNSHINFDGNFSYRVNDNWSIKGESEYGREFNYAGENETLQNSVYEQFYVTGPVGGSVTKIGRFSAYSPSGLVYDDKVSGGQVTFGKVLKTTLETGRASSTDDNAISNYHSQSYFSTLFDLPLSADTNVHAGYYKIAPNTLMNQSVVNGNNDVTYYTAQIDTQFATNWNIKAVYAKSNATGSASANDDIISTDQTAYLVRATYKNFNIAKPGTYDLFAMYRMSPQLASYSITDDWRQNTKGTRIGFDYSLDENVGLTTWYTLGKDVDTNANNNEYRIEIDYNF
jgi:hypothetical protein